MSVRGTILVSRHSGYSYLISCVAQTHGMITSTRMKNENPASRVTLSLSATSRNHSVIIWQLSQLLESSSFYVRCTHPLLLPWGEIKGCGTHKYVHRSRSNTFHKFLTCKLIKSNSYEGLPKRGETSNKQPPTKAPFIFFTLLLATRYSRLAAIASCTCHRLRTARVREWSCRTFQCAVP